MGTQSGQSRQVCSSNSESEFGGSNRSAKTKAIYSWSEDWSEDWSEECEAVII
jgi:hypothetical protein